MPTPTTRRICARDIDRRHPALVLAPSSMRDIPLQLLREWDTRHVPWDGPVALYAIQHPDGSGHRQAVPMRTHDIPPGVSVSIYHQLLGITIEDPHVEGVVVLQEAYMGAYTPDDTTALADRVTSEEVRVALYVPRSTGLAATGARFSAIQVRGREPQAHDDEGTFGGDVPLVAQRILGNPLDAPTLVTDLEVVIDQLRAEFPWHTPDGVLRGAFHGEKTRTTVARLRHPLSTPALAELISPDVVCGCDLADYVRSIPGSPPLTLTPELYDWWSPEGVWQLMHGRPQRVPPDTPARVARMMWAREQVAVLLSSDPAKHAQFHECLAGEDTPVATLLSLFSAEQEMVTTHVALPLLTLPAQVLSNLHTPAWFQQIAATITGDPLADTAPAPFRAVERFMHEWMRQRQHSGVNGIPVALGMADA